MFGHKEAAIAGIGVNGLRWRYTISGVKSHVEALNSIFERDVTVADIPAITASTTAIASRFKKFMGDHLPEDDLRYDEIEAIEMMEQDTPTYEIENGSFNDFVENYRYHMDILYDMADYHRALVK